MSKWSRRDTSDWAKSRSQSKNHFDRSIYPYSSAYLPMNHNYQIQGVRCCLRANVPPGQLSSLDAKGMRSSLGDSELLGIHTQMTMLPVLKKCSAGHSESLHAHPNQPPDREEHPKGKLIKTQKSPTVRPSSLLHPGQGAECTLRTPKPAPHTTPLRRSRIASFRKKNTGIEELSIQSAASSELPNGRVTTR